MSCGSSWAGLTYSTPKTDFLKNQINVLRQKPTSIKHKQKKPYCLSKIVFIHLEGNIRIFVLKNQNLNLSLMQNLSKFSRNWSDWFVLMQYQCCYNALTVIFFCPLRVMFTGIVRIFESLEKNEFGLLIKNHLQRISEKWRMVS